MDFGFAIQVMRSAVFHILVTAAPVLLTGLLVGLIVSIIQATTSIQEQTLTFVPKIAAILLALFYFGPWMIRLVVQFTQNLFETIPQMVG